MEKQKVKGTVAVAGADGKCCFITSDSKDDGNVLNCWWPYLLPVGAEVEVTVKIK